MNHNEENLSPIGRSLLNRRGFMKNTGFSLGALGLAQLLGKDGLLASDDPTSFSGKAPIRPDIDSDKPYAPRDAHFKGAAKQVLVIFCPGAVSHVDTFDYKPELIRRHGQPLPGNERLVSFQGPNGNLTQPLWKFRPQIGRAHV